MSCREPSRGAQHKVFSVGLAVSIALLTNAVAVWPQSQNDFAAWEKYDFIPGDTILFFDDFSADPLGTVPEMWDLNSGDGQVVEAQNGSWLRATEDTEIDPFLESPLPPAFTVEFEANILRGGKPGHWQVSFFAARKKEQCEFTFDSQFANFLTQTGSAYSAELSAEGIHRLAILFEDGRFKCYMDNQRLFEVTAGSFTPATLRIGMYAGAGSKDQKAMFTNFRVTQKRKTAQQHIYEDGKWLCYGIYFNFSAATLRGQSHATLAQIGELLQKDPTLNLRIEDHTNDKEEAQDNIRLSQLRAETVQEYLVQKYHLSTDRLQTKGWGSGRPLGRTDTPDGLEMNRRVEFVKMKNQ